MKIYTKRTIAALIDIFVVAFASVVCIKIVSFLPGISTQIISRACVLGEIFLRDLICKNASIGKKVMGLMVLDENWEVPKRSFLIGRAFFSSTIGYYRYILMWFRKENKTEFFEWEKEHLKAYVVDVKVYDELKEKTSGNADKYKEEMSLLYEEYIYKQYYAFGG